MVQTGLSACQKITADFFNVKNYFQANVQKNCLDD